MNALWREELNRRESLNIKVPMETPDLEGIYLKRMIIILIIQ
jgi:hypothetical protein